MERQSWCFAIWTWGLEVSLFHFISTCTCQRFFLLVFCFFLLLSISSILSLFTIYLPDIDECKSDISLCDVNANCSNTYGSYKCTCKEGYNGTGLACTGIMNLLCFNLCLGLGTGILSVESFLVASPFWISWKLFFRRLSWVSILVRDTKFFIISFRLSSSLSLLLGQCQPCLSFNFPPSIYRLGYIETQSGHSLISYNVTFHLGH